MVTPVAVVGSIAALATASMIFGLLYLTFLGYQSDRATNAAEPTETGNE